MFEKSKILMLESEFRNITVNIYFTNTGYLGLYYSICTRSDGAKICVDNVKFTLEAAKIKEYFNNFCFDLNNFKNENVIVPYYDFNLIIDLNVEKCDIRPVHPSDIGGFIFNHITFKIGEYTFDDEDKTVDHRTLHEFKFGKNNSSRIIKRLHLKANKQYDLSLFDEINQRIINHNRERYGVDIDFTLRLYYTEDEYRDFDETFPWDPFWIQLN